MWDLVVIYYCCIMMTQSFNLLGLSLVVWTGPGFSHIRVLLLLLELVPILLFLLMLIGFFGAQLSLSLSPAYQFFGAQDSSSLLDTFIWGLYYSMDFNKVFFFFATNAIGVTHTHICSKAYL